jgi:hypothetical protein
MALITISAPLIVSDIVSLRAVFKGLNIWAIKKALFRGLGVSVSLGIPNLTFGPLLTLAYYN